MRSDSIEDSGKGPREPPQVEPTLALMPNRISSGLARAMRGGLPGNNRVEVLYSSELITRGVRSKEEADCKAVRPIEKHGREVRWERTGDKKSILPES
jgi:hypothetical protein